MLWYVVLCCVILYHLILCYSILYYIILYHIILYYIILYCMMLYYIVLYVYVCVSLSLHIYIYIYNVIAWDVKVAMAPLGPGGAAARPDGPGPCPFLQDLYILMIKSIFQITIYSS